MYIISSNMINPWSPRFNMVRYHHMPELSNGLVSISASVSLSRKPTKINVKSLFSDSRANYSNCTIIINAHFWLKGIAKWSFSYTWISTMQLSKHKHHNVTSFLNDGKSKENPSSLRLSRWSNAFCAYYFLTIFLTGGLW